MTSPDEMTMSTTRLKVLCVDDEPNVLEGLTLHLSRAWHVATATSGALALDMLARDGSFAVVISDMRMPGMDGVSLLRTLQHRFPDTVGILLAGQWQLDVAIAAVNDGSCFRALTKPCAPEVLISAVTAATRQHRLITTERRLLEQTLCPTIKVLTDVLALTSPTMFGRSVRIARLASELASAVSLAERWPVEVAAMFSQIGAVVLAPDVVETEAAARLPVLAERMLSGIPRLEPVREILAAYASPMSAGSACGVTRLGVQILHLAVELDDLERTRKTESAAVATLRDRGGKYDPRLLDAAVAMAKKPRETREVSLPALQAGMVLADDVRTPAGTLLAAAGHVVTPAFIERLRNLGGAVEPVRVFGDDPAVCASMSPHSGVVGLEGLESDETTGAVSSNAGQR
jgi:CheY-like chemotaxis protein